MIANDDGLRVTLERLGRFQKQAAQLRRLESDPTNYRASVSGFLAEIDRMQLEVREYLATHPAVSENEAAWAEEVERRHAEIKSGAVTPLPGPETLAELEAEFA